MLRVREDISIGPPSLPSFDSLIIEAIKTTEINCIKEVLSQLFKRPSTDEDLERVTTEEIKPGKYRVLVDNVEIGTLCHIFKPAVTPEDYKQMFGVEFEPHEKYK